MTKKQAFWPLQLEMALTGLTKSALPLLFLHLGRMIEYQGVPRKSFWWVIRRFREDESQPWDDMMCEWMLESVLFVALRESILSLYAYMIPLHDSLNYLMAFVDIAPAVDIWIHSESRELITADTKASMVPLVVIIDIYRRSKTVWLGSYRSSCVFPLWSVLTIVTLSMWPKTSRERGWALLICIHSVSKCVSCYVIPPR